MQLQVGEFAPGDTAGAGDDEQRRQVAHKHGKNVLQSQGDGLLQGHFSVQLEGGFGQTVGCFHKKTSLSITINSIAFRKRCVNCRKRRTFDFF